MIQAKCATYGWNIETAQGKNRSLLPFHFVQLFGWSAGGNPGRIRFQKGKPFPDLWAR